MKSAKKIFLAFIIFSLSLSAFSQEKTQAQTSKIIDLVSEANKDGMIFYYDPFSESGLLEKNGHQISFSAGNSFYLQDYKNLVNISSPFFKDGTLVATSEFFASVENFFKTENDMNPYKIGAILIDPGHGGKDPGANHVHTINGKKVNVVEKT